jgi:hypothetical protein
LADGNASQSNPRLPVELLSRNGKIKSFIGAVAMFNCQIRLCFKIDGNKSFWANLENKESFEEKILIGEILFKDIGSHEFFEPMRGARLLNFLASIPPDASEQNRVAVTKTENIMAKKKSAAKAAKSPKVGGKIQFVTELLIAGKYTKEEVATQLSNKFGVPEKTAKNTVSWAASTCKERTGKESNHLPGERAVKSEVKSAKSAKAKKPAKKKAAKKVVAPETAPEPAAE